MTDVRIVANWRIEVIGQESLKGSFWDDKNVQYLDLSDDYMGADIHNIHQLTLKICALYCLQLYCNKKENKSRG